MANIKAENFELKFGYNPDWLMPMLAVFNKTEMRRGEKHADKVNRAFMNSAFVVSLWKEDRIVGIGRMITDFEMYSSIVDVVVDPEFQKMGLGQRIMEALISKASQTCIHLTSTFGNEAFYHRLGFRYHKSAMALYPESFGKSKYLDWERSPEI